MTEEDAFIRALRERPDDEPTRFVYADWLGDSWFLGRFPPTD